MQEGDQRERQPDPSDDYEGALSTLKIKAHPHILQGSLKVLKSYFVWFTVNHGI